MFKNWLKSEFKAANFLFPCEDLNDLVICKWSLRASWYLVYRFFVAFYVSFAFGLLTTSSERYFIYFTNWSYVLIVLNFVVKAFAAIKYYPRHEKHSAAVSSSQSYLLKVSWLLTNISTSAAILVTAVFWIIIAPKQKTLIGHADIHSHVLNSVISIVDLLTISIPCKLLHFYQPLTYGLAYLAFTIIYWELGGVNNVGKRPIYSFIDWDKPTSVLIFFCALLAALVVVYLFCYSLAKLRDYVGKNVEKPKETANNSHPHDLEHVDLHLIKEEA